jgi:FkbM family methyltransferase
MLKRVVKSALARMGVELRRKRPRGRRALVDDGRGSLAGSLFQTQTLGFAPATCIDVGAAFGTFTIECARIFPKADYLLVEPLDEYRPFLESVVTRLPRARYAPVVAVGRSGEATINVHADLVGSSLLRETEGPATDGTARVVPARTLDDLCRAQDLRGPYLLKVDVQGAELDVLEGARDILPDTDYVLLEVSLFRFFVGGPDVADVIAFMRARGFVAYDVFHPIYRPLDDALSQLDLAFVKDGGLFRRQHVYATPEQRRAQDVRFAKMLGRARADLARRAAQ